MLVSGLLGMSKSVLVDVVGLLVLSNTICLASVRELGEFFQFHIV